jgi:putative DNA primase/helicase
MNDLINEATTAYLASLDPACPPSAVQIEAGLLAATNSLLVRENLDRPRVSQFTILKQLTFEQVARVLLTVRRVINIAPSLGSDPDKDLLAVYAASGPFEGTYATSEVALRAAAREFNRQLTLTQAKEVLAILRERAPRVVLSTDPDLVPMNNGIFNYRTKELLPFSPEYVFLAKADVRFDPSATSPLIRTPDGDTWEFFPWLEEVLPDPELRDAALQCIGAVLRPNVSWNKAAFFFSEKGNNGKGTIITLMRALLGEGNYASLPLADMGKDFMLEPLTRASAIIVDENDVGQFIDKAANLKAIITNDVLMINRKNKVPISYRFHGFMVQCLNEFPRIKDRSESFYRRQLFIPFDKSFTGRERRYIKDQYMSDPAVLEYVAKYVLVEMPDYYQIDEPQASRDVLSQYKEFNDPVRAFWNEHADQFVWDLLPFPFLYDMYLAWFAKTNPSGSPIGRNVFINDLVAVVESDEKWYCAGKSVRVRSAGRMDVPEHMIADYDLTQWANPNYPVKGTRDLDKSCMPPLKDLYCGIQRY